jgi:hypothetical protein
LEGYRTWCKVFFRNENTNKNYIFRKVLIFEKFGFGLLSKKGSYKSKCPSPDGRENPFFRLFFSLKKDWNDSRK